MFVEGFVVGCIVGIVPVLVVGFDSLKAAAAFLVCIAVCFGFLAVVVRPPALEKLISYVLTFFNP